MTQQAEEYLQLKKELDENLGVQYLQRKKTLERSLMLLAGNFKELATLVDFIENPEIYLKLEINEKTDLQPEIIRFLHNYLASAKSLVDHTRGYVKKWHDKDDFDKKYQDKVKLFFAENSASKMIQDLRNYLLHRGLPPSTIRETFNIETRDPPEIKVLFNKKNLEEWKGWTSKSKEYMGRFERDIELKKLVSEYQEILTDFYSWFNIEIDLFHKEELILFDNIKEKITAHEAKYR